MIQLVIKKDLYSYKYLKQAIQDYSEYCSTTIIEYPDKWILVFNKCKYDEDLTVKEFENYLIGLENG